MCPSWARGLGFTAYLGLNVSLLDLMICLRYVAKRAGKPAPCLGLLSGSLESCRGRRYAVPSEVSRFETGCRIITGWWEGHLWAVDVRKTYTPESFRRLAGLTRRLEPCERSISTHSTPDEASLSLRAGREESYRSCKGLKAHRSKRSRRCQRSGHIITFPLRTYWSSCSVGPAHQISVRMKQ